MPTKVVVLECKSGISKKGNPYHIALVRVAGAVGKVFSDLALPVTDKEISVDLVLASNQEMFLSPRIKGISAMK